MDGTGKKGERDREEGGFRLHSELGSLFVKSISDAELEGPVTCIYTNKEMQDPI